MRRRLRRARASAGEAAKKTAGVVHKFVGAHPGLVTGAAVGGVAGVVGVVPGMALGAVGGWVVDDLVGKK